MTLLDYTWNSAYCVIVSQSEDGKITLVSRERAAVAIDGSQPQCDWEKVARASEGEDGEEFVDGVESLLLSLFSAQLISDGPQLRAALDATFDGYANSL